MADLATIRSIIPIGIREDVMRRKGKQTGSVRYRSGSWYVRFSEWAFKDGEWDWRETERRIEDNGQKLNEKRALMLGYEQHVSKANQLNKAPQGLMNLETFVELHYLPNVVQNYGRVWGNSVRSMLRLHIMPAFGRLQMNEVRRAMVQSFVQEKSKTLSSGSIKQITKVLKSLYDHALSLDFEVANPADRVKLPKLTYVERTAYTMDQIRQLAAKLRETNHEDLARFTLFLSLSGVRRGEALALRWRDINFQERFVQVTGTYDLKGYTPGKNKSALRRVPLAEEAVEILQQQLQMTTWNGQEHPVFAARNGKPLNAANALKRHVKPLAIQIGLLNFDWHSERHTAVTASDGHLTPDQRRAVYGHSSADMTSRYTHAEFEDLRDAIDRVAKGRPN